jgi:hypothetical protein
MGTISSPSKKATAMFMYDKQTVYTVFDKITKNYANLPPSTEF